ncbi:unnamed protein product [Pleuronectes platessa]|uniref:Uncharacterized protein n=1 Tax=Pleuronectes platessa TaxID=8262 RepID=A0A9N7Z246_PLEPL|nr:unnamed protein product [Pleuronectes platessa]
MGVVDLKRSLEDYEAFRPSHDQGYGCRHTFLRQNCFDPFQWRMETARLDLSRLATKSVHKSPNNANRPAVVFANGGRTCFSAEIRGASPPCVGVLSPGTRPSSLGSQQQLVPLLLANAAFVGGGEGRPSVGVFRPVITDLRFSLRTESPKKGHD